MESGVPSESKALTALVVALFLAGVVTFAVGRTLVAGVCFLALSLAIYLRETRK